jgi:hypothetical protein
MSRRRPAALVLFAVGVSLLAGPAAAKAPDQTGWWFQPKDGPTADVVPPPPDAPPDGLYLFEGVPFDPMGSNALAIAALRFTAAPNAPASITLDAADGSTFTGADVRACPAAGPWEPTTGPGTWSSRPKFDCSAAMAFGQASGDGSAMSWPLGAAFAAAPGSSVYDVVLVPWGPLPFRVGVVRPDAGAIEVAEPGPEGGSPPARSRALPVDRGAAALRAAAPLRFAAPRTPHSELASGGNGATAAATARGPAADSTRAERILAALLLFAMAGALWWFGSSSARPPRFVGSTTGRSGQAEPVARGIGRFARPREKATASL